MHVTRLGIAAAMSMLLCLGSFAHAQSPVKVPDTNDMGKFTQEMRKLYPNLTIKDGALQPCLHAANEDKETRKLVDEICRTAISTTLFRLDEMVAALKLRDPSQRAQRQWHCDRLKSVLTKSFTHIEGKDTAPLRDVDHLYKVCMDPNQWIISEWDFYCVQMQVVSTNPPIAEEITRYWQNQLEKKKKKNGHYRHAKRTLVGASDGGMLLDLHGAYEVDENAVDDPAVLKENCTPLPAFSNERAAPPPAPLH